MLKAKLKAAAWHGVVTIIVASLTAYLVFFIWYPGRLSEFAAGSNIYRIIVMAEIVLGPVISLVIYNANKGRAELILDYFCVGLIQLAALAYGLYSVALSRPVYLVFVKDRIELVSHGELSPVDLTEAGMSVKSLPWFGPEFICTEGPTDPDEQFDLIMSALQGKDIQFIPKYYRDCAEDEIERRMRPLQDLSKSLPENLLEDNGRDYYWLPISSRFGMWTAIFPDRDLNQVRYLEIDPL